MSQRQQRRRRADRRGRNGIPASPPSRRRAFPAAITDPRVGPIVEALRGRQCLMCNLPGHGVAVFVPHTPETWGAPAGKERVMLFPLCSACEELPLERREAVLREELVRRETAGCLGLVA